MGQFNPFTGGGGTAEKIQYNNTTSELQALDVQSALDEIVSKLNALNITKTQAEYDALTQEEKNNGSYYFIVDSD